MTHDSFDRGSTLNLIAAAFSDLADLARKEIRLAVAEMAQRAAATARAMALLAVAGVFVFVALLVFAAGLVLAIASAGLALFWSCFIVAGGFVVLAGLLALIARGSAGLTPKRALAQLDKDAKMTRDMAK
jgi:hypothetical protein